MLIDAIVQLARKIMPATNGTYRPVEIEAGPQGDRSDVPFYPIRKQDKCT